MIEIAIAVSLLLIGLVSVASATSRMHQLRRENRERVIVQNAVRTLTERLQALSTQLATSGEPWAPGILAVYGKGGTLGPQFEVRGLAPVDEALPIGEIQVITDETASDDALGFDLGMPRDLNGDAAADSTDVSGNAKILPVLITVTWRNHRNGTSTYRHCFYVLEY